MAHLNAQIAAQTAKVEELLATVRKILAIAGSDGIDMEEISQRIVRFPECPAARKNTGFR